MSDKKHRADAWFFNPLEIAFGAYSGSGKSTLIQKLLRRFDGQYQIGYAKHDAHRFDMDRPGKDTAEARRAGAHAVCISSPECRAVICDDPEDLVWRSQVLLENDLVFVEGWKDQSLAPRVLLLDEAGKMESELPCRDLAGVFAVAGPGARPPCLPANLPYFHRDQVDDLAALIREQLARKLAERPLKGLVLVGGLSTRMGEDKAALNYHGRSAARHAAELLAPHCTEVRLSARPGQNLPADCDSFGRVEDRFLGFGPMGGILSAFEADPKAAWLVIGCDLPCVDQEAVSTLLAGRRPERFASCFADEAGLAEPLLAVYEPKARTRLLQFLATGRSCPRKMLLNSRIALLSQQGHDWLRNVNTPEERREVLGQLGISHF